jgi:hypothetical protein
MRPISGLHPHCYSAATRPGAYRKMKKFLEATAHSILRDEDAKRKR